MSSTTTLNGVEDVRDDLQVKDVEASITVIKSSVFPVELGPTNELLFFPIPRSLQHRSEAPTAAVLGIGRICLMSFCTVFLTANLAYCQPLLTHISRTFGLSYDEVAGIPTLMEAGYAAGILFISPLADLVRRRQLILILILGSASLSVGLAFAPSFQVFQVLIFLTGLCTISPQIIITFARDHAHPSRSSTAYSIILTGCLSGVLAGRLMAGVIAHSVPWKFVFYFAFSLQYAILILCYGIIPDFPPKNKKITYPRIWSTMLQYAFAEPGVVQIELISMALGAAVANNSISLTFLLGGAPYKYSTLETGLFGLTDLTGIILSPFAGCLIDGITPRTTLLISVISLLLFQAIRVAASGIHLTALIISCVGIDAFRQLQQISLAAATYAISVEATSRLNALLLISYYVGQLIGTSAGSKIFLQYGWIESAVFGMAWYGVQIILVLMRGPQCKKRAWVGY